MYQKVKVILVFILGAILGSIITYKIFYSPVYNKGFTDGEEWTIKAIQEYDPNQITCEDDCYLI